MGALAQPATSGARDYVVSDDYPGAGVACREPPPGSLSRCAGRAATNRLYRAFRSATTLSATDVSSSPRATLERSGVFLQLLAGRRTGRPPDHLKLLPSARQ